MATFQNALSGVQKTTIDPDEILFYEQNSSVWIALPEPTPTPH
jgi:hypothetical protein